MIDLKSMSQQEITDLMRSLGQPAFRGKQVFVWLHKGARSFEEMTNLPKPLRESLAQTCQLAPPKVARKQISRQDGTIKYLWELADGNCIESVLMRYHHGNTVCISSQVGCRMGCAFCASTIAGKVRNLTPAEMLDQVLFTQLDSGLEISNIVLMGIGEPMDNLDAVLKFLELVNHPDGMNIGMRHISLSPCGIIPGINRFANEPEQFTLAVSLHSAIQPIRNEIMPHVARQSLKSLRSSLERYIEKTNRRVTFEYLLIQDVNDTQEDLDALIKYCRGLLCHVNLLPMNDIEGSYFAATPQKTVKHWLDSLEKHHIEATLRSSRGSDIAGACGQLKNKQGSH